VEVVPGVALQDRRKIDPVMVAIRYTKVDSGCLRAVDRAAEHLSGDMLTL
jgi:hypothetical protein